MRDPVSAVSVIIPCLNEASYLPRLLDTLREDPASLHEVVVVDNGSGDGSPDVVRDYQSRHADWPLRLVTCARPGAAAALNVGITSATGDVIVRLDGHCLPHAGYIPQSVAHLQDDGVGVVGGVWEVSPGSETRVGRAIASALTHRLATGGAAYRHPREAGGPISVDTVPFGCFRKSLWQLVGGYDERRTVNEDYVLNYQARLAGRRVVLDPAIRSTYFARGSFRGLARQYFRYGWVKAGMLKQYPGAIRWRQVIPGAFAAVLILLTALSLMAPAARPLLAAMLASYAAVLLAAAIDLSSRTRAWLEIPLYAVVFAIVQLGWGVGACVNVITFGRWPAWATVAQAHG